MFGVHRAANALGVYPTKIPLAPASGATSHNGVGVELGARYSFSERWGVEGKAGYERLINDAADSPITEAGSANQFGMQILLTRSLSLGF